MNEQGALIEPSRCYDLLFLLFAQDVAHADGAHKTSRRSQRPGLYLRAINGNTLL
jgi:hypothetical protein